MISAICPVQDYDLQFLPIYFDNLSDKIDELILIYTGKDKSKIDMNLIDHYDNFIFNIQLLEYKLEQPYFWPEGVIRNLAINKANFDWILNIDSDEVISDNFNQIICEYVFNNKHNIFNFKFVPFWKDLKTIRLNSVSDNHWYGNQITRLFNRNAFAYDETMQNHSVLKIKNNNRFNLCFLENINLFHLHYALFNRCKINDNRLGDLGLHSFVRSGLMPEIKDYMFNFLNEDNNPQKYYPCITKAFDEEYPKCLLKLL
jgi:hypothetical protein